MIEIADEKEYSNTYFIPANYTDSGKLLGGMLETRNTVEAIFLVLLIGYPELKWLPFSPSIKIVVITITLLPLGVISLMGINGDSLLQYAWHVIHFWTCRRKLHYRRIGYLYVKNQKKEKTSEKRKNTRVCSRFHSGKGFKERNH